MSCSRGCCPTQAAHYKSLTVRTATSSQGRREQQLSRDLDAYGRLRQSGVQPRGIAGAAELERGASTTHEVEHANIITDNGLRRRVTNLFEQAPVPAATPLPDDAA